MISLVLAVAIGQASLAADDAGGAWAILSAADHFGTDDEPSRWRYAFDTQYRYFDRADGLTTVLIRPSIGYELRPGLAVFAGYGYFESELADGSTRHENRVFEQLSWSALRREWGTLSLRTRLAERYIEGGDDVGLWVRQMIRLDVPVGVSRDHRFVLSLEPFFNLRNTDWGAESGFLQNRSFVGLNFRAAKKLRIEAGYMNLYVRRSSAENLANHLLVVNFRVDL
jgi:hypothetical protein